MKIDNIKGKVTHDMENLRKTNQTEIKNTVESHSGRLEKVLESQSSKIK
jgi:hypothetical protein